MELTDKQLRVAYDAVLIAEGNLEYKERNNRLSASGIADLRAIQKLSKEMHEYIHANNIDISVFL